MSIITDRRAYNDAIRAAMPSGSKFSGPRVDTFFEGWTLVGFRHGSIGHYWRRRPGDRVLALCGISRGLDHDILGHLMIFELGNFPKCAKCGRKRQRA